MNRILTGNQVSFQPELIRLIISALLVSALLFPPSLAMSGDTGAGYSLFLGSASLQLATKAPVNVSTTQAVLATQRTVQTAVKTTVATPVPVHTQGTPVTPGPTAAITPRAVTTFNQSSFNLLEKTIDIQAPVNRPFSTVKPVAFATVNPSAFATLPHGALPTYCLSPSTFCGGNCTDTGSDPANCGSCGHACPTGICCSGHCVNWDELDANCGECGKACHGGGICEYGPGWDDCEHRCVRPDGTEYWVISFDIDNSDCGGCGIVCASGTHCASGKCLQNCPEGSVICADTNTCIPRSTQNCAFCGNACRPGESCTNGQCTCPEGYGICDNACVELGTRSHCAGDCHPCPAGYECKEYVGDYATYGTCMMDCPYGYLNCGDGSCKNVQADPQNCGACGNTCGAGRFCSGGTCVSSCPAGTMDCEGDGFCEPLDHDPNNCGGCSTVCPGQEPCEGGVCTTDCTLPNIYEQHCDDMTVGGVVCSDRRTDPLNCGGCGRYCNLHQTCVDETCVEACPPGTQYCDGAGCTNLGYDRNNCGYCGNRCGILCVWGDCRPW